MTTLKTSIYKQKVISYVMNFGKVYDMELQKWMDQNISFQPYYTTQTFMLNGNIIKTEYDKQDFIERLKTASFSKQAMCLKGFLQEQQNEANNLNKIVWKGDFTVDSFVSSPHWKVTSIFNEQHKFIKNIFIQQNIKIIEQQLTAPPLSWKNVEDFKFNKY